MVSADSTTTGGAVGQHRSPDELPDLLLASLEALAAAGQADTACRLAGHACAVLRESDPRGWRKFNALLHRLSKLVVQEAAAD
jgi:hypothetical protein